MSQIAYVPSEHEMKDVNRRFTYHPPQGDQAERYVFLRDSAKALAISILKSCPPTRETSLALTKLEESIFWANASIARNEPHPDQVR